MSAKDKLLVLGVAVAFVVTACGGESDTSPGGSAASPVDELPLLVNIEPLVEGGDEAEIRGALVFEGDCLFVNDNGFRFPLVWPNGTAWDEDAQSVLLNDGQMAAIGQSIFGGGGYSSVDVARSLLSDDAAALVARCVDDESSEVAILKNTNEPLSVAGAPVAIEEVGEEEEIEEIPPPLPSTTEPPFGVVVPVECPGNASCEESYILNGRVYLRSCRAVVESAVRLDEVLGSGVAFDETVEVFAVDGHPEHDVVAFSFPGGDCAGTGETEFTSLWSFAWVRPVDPTSTICAIGLQSPEQRRVDGCDN